MKQKELDKILREHKKWLDGKGGEKADLHGRDLHGVCLSGARLHEADLSGADLSGSELNGADLSEADLKWADLNGANLHGADLNGADLHGADLNGAILVDADLSWANLDEANLMGVDLSGAGLVETNLRGANLVDANLCEVNMEDSNISQDTKFSKKESIRKGMVLTKPMTGYKKTQEGVILKAEIPVGAVVFSINNSKCRSNMATIVDMGGKKILHSMHDNDFTYKKGQKIVIKDFNLNPSAECATGFHFFRTKKEAENY